MVVPLLPLLRRRNFRTGMVPVWLLEKIYEHAVELGQYLLALIYGCLWESASGSMKDVPLWFLVVPLADKLFSYHIEVGPFHFNFIFSSFPGTFLRANEDLGRYMEVVEFFKSKVVKFTCVILQVQDGGEYPFGIYYTPNNIDFFIVPLF